MALRTETLQRPRGQRPALFCCRRKQLIRTIGSAQLSFYIECAQKRVTSVLRIGFVWRGKTRKTAAGVDQRAGERHAAVQRSSPCERTQDDTFCNMRCKVVVNFQQQCRPAAHPHFVDFVTFRLVLLGGDIMFLKIRNESIYCKREGSNIYENLYNDQVYYFLVSQGISK